MIRMVKTCVDDDYVDDNRNVNQMLENLAEIM